MTLKNKSEKHTDHHIVAIGGGSLTLGEVRLWDGTSELYTVGLPVPMVSTGPIVFSSDTLVETDRRFLSGITRSGIRYTYYVTGLGYKHIVLED